jgi:hypothetical protein
MNVNHQFNSLNSLLNYKSIMPTYQKGKFKVGKGGKIKITPKPKPKTTADKVKSKRRSVLNDRLVAAALISKAPVITSRTGRNFINNGWGSNRKVSSTNRARKDHGGDDQLLDAESKKFLLCLTNPFHSGASGAHMPAPYSLPTVPMHSKGRFTIQSDASGNADMVWFGSPLVSAYFSSGVAPGGVTSSHPFSQLGGNPIFSENTLAAFDANYSAYRTTGSGVKLRNLLPLTTATGRIIFAPVPTGATFYGLNAINNVNFPNASLMTKAFGTTYLNNNYVSTAILDLPDADDCTVQDIITEDLMLCIRPCGTDCMNFRTINATTNEQDSNGDSVFEQVVVANNGNIQTGDCDTFDNARTLAGWTGIMIRFEGFPPSVNIIDVEFVTHVETVPRVAGANIIPDGMKSGSHKPQMLERIISIAEKVDWAGVGTLATGFSRLLF